MCRVRSYDDSISRRCTELMNKLRLAIVASVICAVVFVVMGWSEKPRNRLTLDQLKKYDGKHSSSIYVSYGGFIFDVTEDPMFGAQDPYFGIYRGKEVAHSTVMGDLDGGLLNNLGPGLEEKASQYQFWFSRYQNKFRNIGVLVDDKDQQLFLTLASADEVKNVNPKLYEYKIEQDKFDMPDVDTRKEDDTSQEAIDAIDQFDRKEDTDL